MSASKEHYSYISFNEKVFNHNNIILLLTEVENKEEENNSHVIDLINRGEFSNNINNFKKSLDRSKYKEMLTPYSLSDLKEMRVFKLKGYNIGFALKNRKGVFNEIVAVHNNEEKIKGVGSRLFTLFEDSCYFYV